MSKFVTYYNVCPIPEPKDFLGISADKDEGNIITTLGKNMIIIFKISIQKQIRSWSVLEKLSSKVVYDRKSEKYIGVFANRALRCWDKDTLDVNKCKKLKFQKSIADLVTCGEDTLVLYNDGSCELLASAIQSRKEDIKFNSNLALISNLTFTNLSVHTLPNGNRILTYFERNSTNGDYYLVRLTLNLEAVGPIGEETKRFNLRRDDLDLTVAGAAVIEGNGAPMLLTIWSDKRMFLLSLADDIDPQRSPGNFVSILTQLKVDSSLSVLGISEHFVAIYGANHGQEGASLLLYNTLYKVIKIKQFFKVYFNYSHLWTMGDHIVLAMGQNLSVVKYRVLKEVLSELVGTQVTNDLNTVVEIEHINEEDALEDCLKYSAEIQTNQEEIPKEKPIKINPADGMLVAFTGVENFNKELNAIRQLNLQVDIVQDDDALEDLNINLMTSYNDDGFICPEIQLISRELEKAGAGECEITEKLLLVLMKANLMLDIGVCLRRYNNISEKFLAKTLNYILKQYKDHEKPVNEEAISENNSHSQEQMEVEFNLDDTESTEFYPNLDLLSIKNSQKCNSSQVEDILNLLLGCSFDAECIASHMRNSLDYPEVVVLLKHLHNMLTTREPVVLEEKPSLFPSSVDLELQLLRWFGVILNSHFQKLALSKDIELIQLLYKWHELFQSYNNEIEGLQKVAALLHNIVERKTNRKDKGSSKWYSIEEVYLY